MQKGDVLLKLYLIFRVV